MNAMDGYYNSLDNFIKNKPKENKVDIKLYNNPAFSNDIIQYINNIDNIPFEEVCKFVQKYHKIIFNYIFNNISKDKKSVELLKNKIFVNALIYVLQNTQFEYFDKIMVNRVIYEYNQHNQGVDDISELYIIAGKLNNREYIPRLMGLGIPERMAALLSVARYSSLKEDINFRRLNLAMISSSKDLFTPEIIYKIYDIFTTSVTVLFTTIMYDIYTDEVLDYISEDAADVYANIGLVACDVINTLSSEDIRKVLISFASMYKTDDKHNYIRFSMKSLSQSEYQRVYTVIDDIEKNSDLIVP